MLLSRGPRTVLCLLLWGPRTVLCLQKPLGKIWIGGFEPQRQTLPTYVNLDSGRGCPSSPSQPCSLLGEGTSSSHPVTLSRMHLARAHTGWQLACYKACYQIALPWCAHCGLLGRMKWESIQFFWPIWVSAILKVPTEELHLGTLHVKMFVHISILNLLIRFKWKTG